MRTTLTNRYGGLPPWVLLAQLFLASGWQRAAAAHGLEPNWWNGIDITAFRAEHRDTAIEWYRTIMLDGPVAEWPIIIGVVVFAAQVVVGLMLVLNVRPLLALAIGAGLNLNFVLAGAVNPSVFYLIIGAAIALWHVETAVRPSRVQRLTLISTLIAAILLGALGPEIATIDPAHVIDDPAMVLSFFALLWVLALWVGTARNGISPLPLTRGGPSSHNTASRATTSPGGTPLNRSRARCRHLNRVTPISPTQ